MTEQDNSLDVSKSLVLSVKLN